MRHQWRLDLLQALAGRLGLLADFKALQIWNVDTQEEPQGDDPLEGSPLRPLLNPD